MFDRTCPVDDVFDQRQLCQGKKPVVREESARVAILKIGTDEDICLVTIERIEFKHRRTGRYRSGNDLKSLFIQRAFEDFFNGNTCN